jgi:hypothetical protein
MSLTAAFVKKLIRKNDLYQEIYNFVISQRPSVKDDPVQRIHRLEDRSDVAYLWDLDCTDKQLMELTNRVKTSFVRKNNRNPRALHLIRNDVSTVSELSPEEIRESVQPFLEDTDDGA